MSHLPENYSGASTDTQLLELWLSSSLESTQGVYRPVAEAFLKEVDKEIRELKVADVVAWAERLSGGAATKARKVSTIKSLLSYAHRTGYTLFNVGLPLRVRRPPDMLYERILDVENVHNVIRQANSLRDRTLMRFLYASGARITEAVMLRFKDINKDRVTLIGKGRRVRTILIPTEVAESLRALKWARDLPESFVFKSFRGKRLQARNARQIVNNAAKEAGVKMSPHWFRHAHASHALDNGAPIHLVQKCLDHRSLDTTTRYVHARPTDGASQFIEVPS